MLDGTLWVRIERGDPSMSGNYPAQIGSHTPVEAVERLFVLTPGANDICFLVSCILDVDFTDKWRELALAYMPMRN